MTKLAASNLVCSSCAVLALLTVSSGLQAQVAPQKAPKMTAVVDSNSKFALDLYKQLSARAGDDNIFVSPYSVSTVLAMTYAGSRNATQRQIAGVLHFNMPDASLLSGFSDLLAQTKAAPNKSYQLDVANAVWAEKTSRIEPAYTSAIDKYFGGGFHSVDFIHDPHGSRQQINKSVADSTEGKIQNLLGPRDVKSDTRLVLTSAIYFKGTWASQFKTQRTADAPFTLRNGKQVTVHLMEQVAHFQYVKQNGLAAIKLPYQGNDVSMIVILPDGDITKLEASLTLQELQSLQKNMRSAKVDVFLPRFNFQTRYLMADALVKMGMPDAFNAKRADFSGIDGKNDLYIGQVVHQATIEVDEVGSVAAAATAVTILGAAMMPAAEPIQIFRADRPFLLMIVHNATGSILFMGRVSSPAAVSASESNAK